MLAILAVWGLVGAAASPYQGQRAIAAKRPLPGKPYHTSYALIVGIDRTPDAPDFPTLRCAAADATSVAEVLEKRYGFSKDKVFLLTDAAATGQAIRQRLVRFEDGSTIKPDDRIIVFFACHGRAITSTSGVRSFLIPADANVPKASGDNVAPYETCVDMGDVWKHLRSSPANHILVLADSCFSGTLGPDLGPGGPSQSLDEPVLACSTAPETQSGESKYILPTEPALRSFLAGRELEVISACGRDQTAQERTDLNHGLFTSVLLAELDGRAHDPGFAFTTSTLFATIESSVSSLSNGQQTPKHLGGNEAGRFVFDPGGILKPYDPAKRTSPLVDAMQDVVDLLNRIGKFRYTHDDNGHTSILECWYDAHLERDQFVFEQNEVEKVLDSGMEKVVSHRKRTLRTSIFDLEPYGTSSLTAYTEPVHRTDQPWINYYHMSWRTRGFTVHEEWPVGGSPSHDEQAVYWGVGLQSKQAAKDVLDRVHLAQNLALEPFKNGSSYPEPIP